MMTLREPLTINYMFEVFGAGGDGSLNIEPKLIDFEIVKVNFNLKVSYIHIIRQRFATLHNLSNCTFYVELNLHPVNSNPDKYDPHTQAQIEKSFTLDLTSGYD